MKRGTVINFRGKNTKANIIGVPFRSLQQTVFAQNRQRNLCGTDQILVQANTETEQGKVYLALLKCVPSSS